MIKKLIHSGGVMVACLAAVGLLTGCPADNQDKPVTSASPAEQAAAQTAARVYARYTGPKKRIAVSQFTAKGDFVAQYGGYDIGGGLAAQLMTELVKTGRFVVVERTDLSSVLREQKLGATKLTHGETAARLGQLTGAQLLVRGAVTEFSARSGGGGIRLGGTFSGFGGLLGRSTETAHVGIDLRLIDTTTGQIVKATNAEGKAESSAISADITKAFSMGDFKIGGDTFKKTPIGKATRQAISSAVDIIIKQMEKVPWTASVMTSTGGLTYITAGKDTGVAVGDKFSLYRKTKELKDPTTGVVVGILKAHIADITVRDVQAKFSAASYVPVSAGEEVIPERGDLVQLPRNR